MGVKSDEELLDSDEYETALNHVNKGMEGEMKQFAAEALKDYDNIGYKNIMGKADDKKETPQLITEKVATIEKGL